MIILSKAPQKYLKKVHCPVCGARLCNVKNTESIRVNNHGVNGDIILKCYNCKGKIGISIQND